MNTTNCPFAAQLDMLPPEAYGPLITIKTTTRGGVGADYLIHRGLLFHHSGDFQRVFNDPTWTGEEVEEDGQEVCELYGEDPEMFDLVQTWLYTRRLCDFAEDRYKTLCGIYVLAESLNMPAVKNAVIDACITSVDASSFFRIDLTRKVYDSTSENDSFRKLITQGFAKVGGLKLLEEDPDFFDSFHDVPILVDLCLYLVTESADISALTTQTGSFGWGNMNRCQFHVHEIIEDN